MFDFKSSNKDFKRDVLNILEQFSKKIIEQQKEIDELKTAKDKPELANPSEGMYILEIIMYDTLMTPEQNKVKTQAVIQEIKPILAKYGIIGINSIFAKQT